MTSILFCSAEVAPFSKTGGLGDLANALPTALSTLVDDICVVTPAYRGAAERGLMPARKIARLQVDGFDQSIDILETRLGTTGVTCYLVDAGTLFDRAGGPYQDLDGRDYADNPLRFAVFCRAIVEIAMGRCDLGFRPDILHLNDWQTGLVPLLLRLEKSPPPSLFVVHNLQYQGVYSHAAYQQLKLPDDCFTPDGVEFHGNFSFIKSGLVYAERLVTVSPSYAEEIKTPAYGCGLDGLLRHRAEDLLGIINGIDSDTWNPATDPLIERCFDATSIDDKRFNKVALQTEFGLEARPSAMVAAHIGRLATQKGADLIIDAAQAMCADKDVQLVILGAGDHEIAASLTSLSASSRGAIAFREAFDERLAHRIEAGADLLLMPSRYEPCGLNQLYSMRYGTVPLVRRTGGLKDTVRCQAENDATGFCFDEFSRDALVDAWRDAVGVFRDEPARWRSLIRAGMSQDFSWRQSAIRYCDLYDELLGNVPGQTDSLSKAGMHEICP